MMSPTNTNSPFQAPPITSKESSTSTSQQPRSLSFYEILALVRLELILLLLCLGQAVQVFIFIPMKAQGIKEIFLGMKVTLDRSTSFVLAYSDLIIAYPFLVLILVCLLLAALVAGIRHLAESARYAYLGGNEALARFQVTATIALAGALVFLVSFGAYADRVLTVPLLRLISVGN